MTGIYYINNKITSEKYIGYSKDILRRWQQHKKDLIKNCHHNSHLQNVYNKYGDIFEYNILEECTIEELKEKEKYYIALYDTVKHGYNQTEGGDGIPQPSEELCQRLHDSAMQREIWKNFPDVSGEHNPRYGTCVSEETRRKMSKSASNRVRTKHTEETKRRMSIIAKQNNFITHLPSRTGTHCSQETKNKIGKANSKKIQASTGEIFDSIKEAKKWCNSQNVSACCNHRQKTAGTHPITHEKISWRYYDQ